MKYDYFSNNTTYNSAEFYNFLVIHDFYSLKFYYLYLLLIF